MTSLQLMVNWFVLHISDRSWLIWSCVELLRNSTKEFLFKFDDVRFFDFHSKWNFRLDCCFFFLSLSFGNWNCNRFMVLRWRNACNERLTNRLTDRKPVHFAPEIRFITLDTLCQCNCCVFVFTLQPNIRVHFPQLAMIFDICCVLFGIYLNRNPILCVLRNQIVLSFAPTKSVRASWQRLRLACSSPRVGLSGESPKANGSAVDGGCDQPVCSRYRNVTPYVAPSRHRES